MSQVETQDVLSEAEENTSDADAIKFVPVGESIRYRRRAQVAEKKAETLAEQLQQTQSQVTSLSEQLSDMQKEQQLIRKLSAAGAVDVEGAVAIARAKLRDDSDADLDGLVEQMKKDKQYLFAEGSRITAAGKTAGVRERVSNPQAALSIAAKKAATTGNRVDLQEYLRLRRNFV